MKTRVKALIVSIIAFVVVVAIVTSSLYFCGVFDVRGKEADYENGQMSVMSANIRRIMSTDKGAKAWKNRARLTVKNIRLANPTILGMQEVTKQQYRYFNGLRFGYYLSRRYCKIRRLSDFLQKRLVHACK